MGHDWINKNLLINFHTLTTVSLKKPPNFTHLKFAPTVQRNQLGTQWPLPLKLSCETFI